MSFGGLYLNTCFALRSKAHITTKLTNNLIMRPKQSRALLAKQSFATTLN